MLGFVEAAVGLGGGGVGADEARARAGAREVGDGLGDGLELAGCDVGAAVPGRGRADLGMRVVVVGEVARGLVGRGREDSELLLRGRPLLFDGAVVLLDDRGDLGEVADGLEVDRMGGARGRGLVLADVELEARDDAADVVGRDVGPVAVVERAREAGPLDLMTDPQTASSCRSMGSNLRALAR